MSSADSVIYLDHAATTPLDPEALRAMTPFFTERFGNPSSIYALGQDARAALDSARSDTASVLGCQTAEITFTSGATESNSLALHGVAWAARFRDPDGPFPHLVTTAIEHSAVLEAARWLERLGFGLTIVPVDGQGRVKPDDIATAIRSETCLVSVMYANNEVGVVQDLPAISQLTRAAGIPFHTDAVQAGGSLPVRVDELGVDLLTLSAHKFYGPKGIGLLYHRRGVEIAWQLRGGGQEQGRRGGTEAVAHIVGMAVALARAEQFRPAYAAHCRQLRDRLWDGLRAAIPDLALNGPELSDARLPNNLNVSIPGVQGETTLLSLDMEGIAASAGSACTAGKQEPSHVLEAMGLPEALTRSSLRLTVGRSNTAEQIDGATDTIVDVIERVRALTPVS